MKNLVYIFIPVLVILNTAFIKADTLTVEYLQGIIEIKEGSGWVELFIDDEISPSSTLKVNDASFIELIQDNGTRFSLFQQGTYYIENIILESEKLDSYGIDSVFTRKMTALVSDDDLKDVGESPMGVRGDAIAEEMEWMDDEILNDFLDTGIRMIREKSYKDAIVIFEDALGWADDDKAVLFNYYIALAYTELGNYGIASSYIKNVYFDTNVPVYHDYIVLLGKLLIYSIAYNEALKVFEGYLREYKNPSSNTAQAIYYLSSICYINLGDKETAVAELNKAKGINPDNAIGKLAGEMLNKII